MQHETKMQILTRLVKDGSISLEEAFILNEAEVKVVESPVPSLGWPITTPNPWSPFQPNSPQYPWGSTCGKPDNIMLFSHANTSN